MAQLAADSKLLRHVGYQTNGYHIPYRAGGSLPDVFVMAFQKLPNYIRSHRKCCGFSQNDVAFLLSSSNGAKISRYENFTQQPNLETAIALAVLFHTPVRTLFEGVTQKAERKIIKRIELLICKLEAQRENRVTMHKREVLKTLYCELRQLRGQAI